MPRAYLKQFTPNGVGKHINLFNLARRKTINRAPLSGQCAKDYFYGKDLQIEKALGELESAFATNVRKIRSSPEHVTGEQLEDLKGFMCIQASRTRTATEETAAFMVAIEEELATTDREFVERNRFDRKSAIQLALSAGIKIDRACADLKAGLIVNQSSLDFITSDQPVVHTNRYHIQKLQTSEFGYLNAGTIMWLPLSSRLCIFFYDRNIYFVPEMHGFLLRLADPTDVKAVNEFQFLQARDNVYFENELEKKYFQSELNGILSRRVNRNFEVERLYAVSETSEGVLFSNKETDTKNGKRQELLTVGRAQLIPDNWLSKIKWHPNPRFERRGAIPARIRYDAANM